MNVVRVGGDWIRSGHVFVYTWRFLNLGTMEQSSGNIFIPKEGWKKLSGLSAPGCREVEGMSLPSLK